MPGTQVIRYLTILGDSLSDQGELNERSILCIPLSKLSGLSGKSPKGRFTNGWCWDDYLAAMLENYFKGLDPKNIDRVLANNGNFDDPNITAYDGSRFIEMYSEGGLSAYDYKGKFSLDLAVFFSRLILQSLTDSRQKLLSDDVTFNTEDSQKNETLMIDWTGANDLITMEEKPSTHAAVLAIRAKAKNTEILIENGYKHFYFFNLPDLSLTPDFQMKSEKEQEEAKKVCSVFNKKLTRLITALKEKYPNCTFELFDINAEFTKMYNHPEEYQLDPQKLKTAFTKSVDFKNENSPATGYLFWDGKHPTTHVHRLFAERLFQMLNQQFDMQAPRALTASELSNLFKDYYLKNLEASQSGCFGFFRKSNLHLPNNEALSLKDILKHAFYEGGKRTKKVLIEMEWINKNNEVNPTIPLLVTALTELEQERHLALVI